MDAVTIPSLAERERETRIRVTFDQLERFEDAHHELTHAAVPADIDPAVRQAEIDALASVAGELREELTALAGGRYVCTARHPADPAVCRTIHPAAEDIGECSSGCCDKYRCPRCNLTWTEELPQ